MNQTVPISEVSRGSATSLRDTLAWGVPRDESLRPDERHLRLTQPDAGRAAVTKSPLIGALVAVGVLLTILAVQLGLSIAVSQGAYEARALEIEQRDLSRVERVLSQNVDKLSSPQNLSENAASLGMVQNANPATLRLSDGAVLGALASPTSETRGNLIPNATLDSLPVVDADGLLVDRDAPAADGSQAVSIEPPVRWEGQLPAPQTH